ncbi:hypothetical protein [Gracilibacillus sp. YIM 98692]|uniref:hypothetical protein n=1 Tax=Gracilibacillus sp. YIM 98692 TaxID=2663532 RepID=UPI0013D250EC|nr:hypothetical protein [Gracilibacillus sp. YIM 98692]
MAENSFRVGLLKNGLDFILSSISYLTEGFGDSDLKYGVLHLSAGVDLIFKHRLSKEHWSLIFQDIQQANGDKLKTGRFNSVDSATCIKRLENICNVSFAEKETQQLRKLRETRNQLEHFYTTEDSRPIQSRAIKVMNLILDFVNKQIESEDIDGDIKDLLETLRYSLREFEDLVDERMKKIKNQLDTYKDITAVTFCPACYQQSLVIDDGPFCLYCGNRGKGSEIATHYIEEILGINQYRVVKDGGEFPQYLCEDCGDETLVYTLSEFEDTAWICFLCGISHDEGQIGQCISCGQVYAKNEEDIGMCGNCIDNRIS